MKKLSLALVASLVLVTAVVFAGPDVPDGDPLVALLQLFGNWSVASSIARGIAFVLIIVQTFKKFAPDSPFTRYVVVIGGVVYAFLQSLSTGMSFVNALVFVLVTSGGAVALYELVFKRALNSLFQVKKVAA